jgi:hypothetical protein
MPTLPDFWLMSFFFWALFVPIHIAILGVAVWARGIFTGTVIALGLFALALFGAFAVEYFVALLYGSDPIIGGGSHKGRAVRQMAPWMLGLTLGYLPIGAWLSYGNYKSEKRWERLKNEHERAMRGLTPPSNGQPQPNRNP